jgi:hypothetical protein
MSTRLTDAIPAMKHTSQDAVSTWMRQQLRDERRRQSERDEIDALVAALMNRRSSGDGNAGQPAHAE